MGTGGTKGGGGGVVGTRIRRGLRATPGNPRDLDNELSEVSGDLSSASGAMRAWEDALNRLFVSPAAAFDDNGRVSDRAIIGDLARFNLTSMRGALNEISSANIRTTRGGLSPALQRGVTQLTGRVNRALRDMGGRGVAPSEVRRIVSRSIALRTTIGRVTSQISRASIRAIREGVFERPVI